MFQSKHFAESQNTELIKNVTERRRPQKYLFEHIFLSIILLPTL